MHESSMYIMKRFKKRWVWKGASVLDVGSKIVKRQNISYRSIFNDCNYVGMDITDGLNVDIIGWENITHPYDIIICGQVIEHVENPFKFIENLSKHFTKLICIIAPASGKIHRHPIDCWRIMPDGMRSLFKYANIQEIEINNKKRDTWGIGMHKGISIPHQSGSILEDMANRYRI